MPDEFLFDPVTRSYGDPSKRPEINSSTIEFIAPAEYTVNNYILFRIFNNLARPLYLKKWLKKAVLIVGERRLKSINFKFLPAKIKIAF